jgi:hypothetical protein
VLHSLQKKAPSRRSAQLSCVAVKINAKRAGKVDKRKSIIAHGTMMILNPGFL